MPKALLIHPDDTVATLVEHALAGETLTFGAQQVTALTDTPSGHKVAILPIAKGAPVIKFGFPIGTATADIAVGAHVHSHNLATALDGTLDYRFTPGAVVAPNADPDHATFEGYVRVDGRVATRNEIWVLPTVGCVARTATRIAALADAALARETGDGPIDGVHAFTHPFGCSQLGDDLDGTRSILAALACHPNAGGVLIVGLGCESNQIAALREEIPAERRAMVRTLVTQLAGDEIDEGVAKVAELVALARAKRSTVGLDRLVLGVKCGGSDGLSGLTANPLVGRLSERVVAAGGSVVLTEIPEMFGAERLLMDRAVDESVFEGIVTMVNDFKRYFLDHNEPVSENPSPGNVAGGITTLEEKSLGAVQKAGRAAVSQVLAYGGRVTSTGLTLLEAPGNDAVSCTALAAAGATAILFTTGRGTPLGFPVPTLKISSNSDLATRKPGWIDFDAGGVLEHGFAPVAEALATTLCAIASGAATAAERNGEREIAIWKRGVTL
ncbi:UxaA family hydrolase [Sphingomonas glacialis]|uniref:Altronate dehydratase n=1 Tax=Sphingomonas glacialis TaxID=658225 RepID=A0A502FTP1_9SPHN|nr:altronate dehydratase family protein [Sphingomonas glacialis]TPG52908.1 altronate dehydratase [Sphingomonas glacialis]